MIEARSLTKAYSDLVRGEVLALSHVTFSAAAGQIYGLLGPNGAGKTTALRILSTVLQPTRGTAIVGGFDVVTQPEMVRHQIGFISANTAVYDRMTAWEMVEYFGRLYGLGEDEHGHEAEGLDRPGHRSRSARANIRRSDDRFGCAYSAGSVERRVRTARPGQVHSIFNAHHARSRATLRSYRHHAPRTYSRIRKARRSPRSARRARFRRVIF